MKNPPPFLGRARELGYLEDVYASPKSEFYPIYGRRRVGKTQLINEFGSRHPSIYYLGKEGPPDLQIREFMRIAAIAFEQPVLEVAAEGVSDWKTALTTVMSMRPKGGKTILALDEFQWMVGTAPELPSIIQELWDTDWKRSGDIFLILCGSYMGFMEKEVLGEKSPLFGRRTGQILLQPFPYREAAEFHLTLSSIDLAQTYFICGGIPYYLEFFDAKLSIAQNIQKNFLAGNGPLAREPELLLREELREIENYNAVLMALATGSSTSAEIAKRIGIPDRNIYYYLQTLTELRFVRRRYPLTGKAPAKRSVRFVIDDPLLSFWFRFVYPNGSLINSLGPAAAYDQLIKPELDAYFGLRFEILCREALADLYVSENVTAAFEIGEYWAKDAQIDIVGRRKDGRIDIGEAKWGTVRSIKALETEVRKRIASYPNPDGETFQPRIFLKKKPANANAPEDFLCHTLDELYSLPDPA